MTGTDIDLDDEPALTAEGEVAAAICGHQVVMQRGDALTADMLDEFRGFVREELAALLRGEERRDCLSARHRQRQVRPRRSDALTSCRPGRRQDFRLHRPHTSLRSSKPSAPPTTLRSKSTMRSLARPR